jgi:hypothetical protein
MPKPSSISSNRKSAPFARAGFPRRGRFFAQLRAGQRRYEGQRAVDKNLEDPVEAAVWYAMALANAGGYSPIAAYERGAARTKGPLSRFDDCRAFERRAAYGALDRLLSRMSTEERERSATA